MTRLFLFATMSTTLTELSAQTAHLGKRLQGLLKQYPDGTVEPDERIFNRILTNHWRHAIGGVHGPFEARYWDAVGWVKSFDVYLRELTEHFTFELEQPERMSKLPVTKRLALPSAELIRLLKIQQGMLLRWAKAGKPSKPQGRKDDDQDLRKRIRQHADALGLDELAKQIGCNRDTLSDFLLGKTKPQEKTMKKLRAYVQSN